jgi:hypothetical protein
VTSGFARAADVHRRLLKKPELPYFVVPHPIVSMSADALKASANDIYDGIAKVVAAGLGAGKR